MNGKIIISVLLFFCVLNVNLQAQPIILSAEEAIALTLKNQYDIQLARIDSSMTGIDNAYAYTLLLPRLNASAAKLWNNSAIKQELASGFKRDTNGIRSNNLTAAVQLNWVLFDGWKMFVSKNKLAALQQLSTWQLKNQIVNAAAATIIQYYYIVRQKQQVKATIEQMHINEDRVKLAEKKLSVGLGAKPELLQAKLDLNAQKAALLSQTTLIDQSKAQLNQQIGYAATDYEVADSIPLQQEFVLSALHQQAAQSNYTLLIAQQNIHIANLQLKETKAAYFPTLSFNAAYNFNRLENKAVVNTFTPLYNRNAGWAYGFGINVPLFNGLATQKLVKQANLNIQYQQLLLTKQKTMVAVLVNNAFQDYELQKKSWQLEEENIVIAKENIVIAVARFKQGISTYLELKEAQKSLEEGYNRLIAARYQLKLAETELLRLAGSMPNYSIELMK
jgi:outer membrane protein